MGSNYFLLGARLCSRHRRIPSFKKSVPAVSAFPTYRVTRPGTFVYQVARETLNNGERWGDIYHLNTNITPERPLPLNAVLRLPPDARVPNENR